VAADAGKISSEYNLRRIGSELEGTDPQLLQAGELKYNPDARGPELFDWIAPQPEA